MADDYSKVPVRIVNHVGLQLGLPPMLFAAPPSRGRRRNGGKRYGKGLSGRDSLGHCLRQATVQTKQPLLASPGTGYDDEEPVAGSFWISKLVRCPSGHIL